MSKFAEICLKRRMPKNLNTLTYQVPDSINIKQGSFVSVPLRNKNEEGVVVGISETKPNYPTKNISELILENPVLEKCAFLQNADSCKRLPDGWEKPQENGEWGMLCPEREYNWLEVEIPCPTQTESNKDKKNTFEEDEPQEIKNSKYPLITFIFGLIFLLILNHIDKKRRQS